MRSHRISRTLAFGGLVAVLFWGCASAAPSDEAGWFAPESDGGAPIGERADGSATVSPGCVENPEGLDCATAAPSTDAGLSSSDGWAGISAPDTGGTPSPTCPEGDRGIVELVGSRSRFCARHRDGRVFCWGSNTAGGLGIGDEDLPYSATPQSVIADAEHLVASADAQACVLKDEGALCWGSAFNRNGYVRTVMWSPAPPTEADAITGIVDIAVGALRALALDGDRNLWAWGMGVADSSGRPTTRILIDSVAKLDAYALTECAVRVDGDVWCWGESDTGQSSNDTILIVPTAIEGLEDAVDVAVGRYHVCALRAGGRVACWGLDGMRGDGTVYEEGSIYSRGDSHFTTVPQPVTGIGAVRKLEAGTDATCAIDDAGELWCWGSYGLTPTLEYATPQRIEGLGPVIDVAIAELPGERFGRYEGAICVLESCGRVLCWGKNDAGQVGDSTTTPRTSPVEVVGLGGL